MNNYFLFGQYLKLNNYFVFIYIYVLFKTDVNYMS
jgi:hypothetical protein